MDIARQLHVYYPTKRPNFTFADWCSPEVLAERDENATDSDEDFVIIDENMSSEDQ